MEQTAETIVPKVKNKRKKRKKKVVPEENPVLLAPEDSKITVAYESPNDELSESKFRSIQVPDVNKMKSSSPVELAFLHPTTVYWNERFTVFGIGMSNGEVAIGGTGKYDHSAPIPENLKQIDVAFMKGEHFMHSMRFVGDTELEIGNVDKVRTPENERKGRVEKFVVEPDEELLGCKIECNDYATFGVNWLTWHLPS